MAIRNVICLVIDRLHAGYLGAYGNTWIRTSATDRLAAESFVLDQFIIDSPNLSSVYRSLWLGLHVLCPTDRETECEPLAARFGKAGWHSTLITDEPQIADHPLAGLFAERIEIGLSESDAQHPHPGPLPEGEGDNAPSRTVVSSVDETNVAAFFAAAADWLESARAPFCLWLHTGTLGKVWDAPLEFREQYTDEDDPSPTNSAEVSNGILPERFDPDELLAITHAYAGQVTLADQLIGSLMTALETAEFSGETLIVLLSPRGFPLGEHRRVGPSDDALYSELTHVPLLLRFPDGTQHAGRSQALVQPADLSATILDACGLPMNDTLAGSGRSIMPLVSGQRASQFDRAYVIGPSEQYAMVTPAWSLRVSRQNAAKQAANEASGVDPTLRTELFAKPDDWFEVNEVADRCPDVVEKMRVEIAHFKDACEKGGQALLPELSPELVARHD